MGFPNSFSDKELLRAINKECSRHPILFSPKSIVRREFLEEFREYVRPFLFIKDGTFDIPSNPLWRDVLRNSKEILEKIILSIGSIEVKGQNGRRSIGTGWLIAQGVIITCDHVVNNDSFSWEEEGDFVDSNGERRELLIDFIKERDRTDENIFRVVQVLKRYPDPIPGQDTEPGPDIAFLRIEPIGSATAPVPIELLDSPVADMDVAVIGFPGEDDETPQLAVEMLERIIHVKRLQPGKILSSVGEDELFHDCSTLADSSGSPVLDFVTGKAVGLHFGNRGNKNLAKPAKIIGEMMRDAGVG